VVWGNTGIVVVNGCWCFLFNVDRHDIARTHPEGEKHMQK
jgi:hypothetical protein